MLFGLKRTPGLTGCYSSGGRKTANWTSPGYKRTRDYKVFSENPRLWRKD